jgi:hypothetical protein
VRDEEMKKRVIKLFWAWQDDQENKWLESMSEEGWKLISYNFLRYTFEKMEPKKYIYKTDFKLGQNHDLQEYLTLFEDAGWEHVTQYSGWHYFRTEAAKVKTPEIYSDNHSKIEMFKKLLVFLLIPLISILLISLTIVFNSSYSHIKFMIVIRIVYVVLIFFLGFAVLKLLYKMKRLKG